MQTTKETAIIYCTECGNELQNIHNFCPKCGAKIIQNNSNNNEIDKNETKQSNEKLPMAWYNFFTYFRLPLSIFLNTVNLFYIYNFKQYIHDKISLGIFFIDIAFIILLIINLYMLHKKIKNTNIYVNILLVAECIFISRPYILKLDIVSAIIVFTIELIIWCIPNYIYFKKRKYIFVNE